MTFDEAMDRLFDLVEGDLTPERRRTVQRALKAFPYLEPSYAKATSLAKRALAGVAVPALDKVAREQFEAR